MPASPRHKAFHYACEIAHKLGVDPCDKPIEAILEDVYRVMDLGGRPLMPADNARLRAGESYFWVRFRHNASGNFEMHCPWWTTGEDVDGHMFVCAAVPAGGAAEAKARVLASFDKGHAGGVKLTFVERREDDWAPFSERFPRKSWMVWGIDPEQEEDE